MTWAFACFRPSDGPRRLKRPPRSQDDPMMAQEASKTTSEGPKRAQDASETPNMASKTALKRPKRALSRFKEASQTDSIRAARDGPGTL
eukprot:3560365-Pyramimonas_sp.AAC.1